MSTFTDTPQISRKLSGHKRPINCMTINSFHEQLLVSGSDDKTVRLWDLRSSKSQKCIAGCFEAGIESVAFCHSNKSILCVASEKSLFTFDIRFEGVLHKTPISRLKDAFEDINQIVAHPKENSVAVADDSGNISIVPITVDGIISDNSAFNRHKRLSRLHNNLIGAVAFRPTNPGELVSGGFDCVAAVWDVARGRPSTSLKLEHLPIPEDEAVEVPRNQTLNPPFVQAVDFACGGRGVLLGLGDGTLRLLNPRTLHNISSVDAHGGMLTAMCVSQADNSVVISGGVDSQLHIWWVKDTSITSDDNQIKKPAGGGKGGKKKGGGGGSAKIDFTARMEKVWSVCHSSKINALVSDDLTIRYGSTAEGEEVDNNSSSSSTGGGDCSSNVSVSGRLFVADMSSDISVYELARSLQQTSVIN